MVRRPRSRVILSDEEVAAAIREANADKTPKEVEQAVKDELETRKARAEARQAEYDPPHGREFVRVTEPIGDKGSGMSATFTKPKD